MHLVVDLRVILVYGEIIFKKIRSRINSNIPAITPDSSLINDTNFIGTSQASIASIVSVSINNTISIDPSHGAKLNKPSWTLLLFPPTMTQTMHSWKFCKKHALAFIFVPKDY
jgi:hypothetical protein